MLLCKSDGKGGENPGLYIGKLYIGSDMYADKKFYNYLTNSIEH